MYKTPYIKELSDRLEGGEISPDQCLKALNSLMYERLELKERAEAILTEQYILLANERKKANWSKERAEVLDAWRHTFPLTNEKLKEGIRFTKAYESGLISDEKLNELDIHKSVQFTDLLKQFEGLFKAGV